MSPTAASMLPRSPFPVCPLKTPQSISTCALEPSAAENETRKQSPNPTRYMRTRTPTSPATGCLPAPEVFVGLAPVFPFPRVDVLADLGRAFVLPIFAAGIFSTPGGSARSRPAGDPRPGHPRVRSSADEHPGAHDVLGHDCPAYF